MSDGTVTERVIRVFADFKKVSTDQITTETSFEELGMDSLDGLNLVFELEEEFDITIPDDRVKEMQSVGQAIRGYRMAARASRGPDRADQTRRRQSINE